jgi:hypothetical protein
VIILFLCLFSTSVIAPVGVLTLMVPEVSNVRGLRILRVGTRHCKKGPVNFSSGLLCCTPSMTNTLEVKVLSKADHGN